MREGDGRGIIKAKKKKGRRGREHNQQLGEGGKKRKDVISNHLQIRTFGENEDKKKKGTESLKSKRPEDKKCLESGAVG